MQLVLKNYSALNFFQQKTKFHRNNGDVAPFCRDDNEKKLFATNHASKPPRHDRPKLCVLHFGKS